MKETIEKIKKSIRHIPDRYYGSLTVKDYKHLIKLNQVLEYCGHETTFEDIRNHFEYDKEQVRSVVMKLARDNYVDIVKEDLTIVDFKKEIGYVSEWKVRRNFEGDLFVEQGSYIQQKINSVDENSRMDRIENELRANRNWTLWLTVVLTVGTIAQALYSMAKLYWEHEWLQYVFPPSKQIELLITIILLLIIISLSVYLYPRIKKLFRKHS